MKCPLLFPLAIFDQLQLCFDHFFIALGVVVDVFTNRALQFNQIVLGHKNSFNLNKIFPENCLEPVEGVEPTTFDLSRNSQNLADGADGRI